MPNVRNPPPLRLSFGGSCPVHRQTAFKVCFEDWAQLVTGDKLLVFYAFGDHGVAIVSVRERIEFDTGNSVRTRHGAASWFDDLARLMLQPSSNIRSTRGPPRGGVLSALRDEATSSPVGIRLDEVVIPVRPEAHMACEMLRLDALLKANHDEPLAVIPSEHVSRLPQTMNRRPLGQNAAVIGEVVANYAGMVAIQSLIVERTRRRPIG